MGYGKTSKKQSANNKPGKSNSKKEVPSSGINNKGSQIEEPFEQGSINPVEKVLKYADEALIARAISDVLKRDNL